MNSKDKALCNENCKHKEEFGTISICKKFGYKHLGFDVKNHMSIPCAECMESDAVLTILVHQL